MEETRTTAGLTLRASVRNSVLNMDKRDGVAGAWTAAFTGVTPEAMIASNIANLKRIPRCRYCTRNGGFTCRTTSRARTSRIE